MEVYPSELIYDAATDVAVLEHLSGSLSEYIGARSGVIHWREIGSEDEHASYSGYYSDEQMAAYSRDFSEDDLWANAISAVAPTNRAIRLEQLVPCQLYGTSRIYNEWIRPMGDDTFHCVGATLRVGRIEGHVGFHRGKRELPFEEESTSRLQHVLHHVGQMMEIKTRLSNAEYAASSVAGTLDALADGLFTLHPSGRLLFCNAAGEAMLVGGEGLRLDRGRLVSKFPQVQKALVAAISRAAAASSPEASTFRQPRLSGGYDVISVIGSSSLGRRSVTVCISAPKATDATLMSRLRALYGLAQAEAEVALGIAAGASVSELAHERGTSVGTVRIQVKATASKLGCSRQAEIAAIVNSIPRFFGC